MMFPARAPSHEEDLPPPYDNVAGGSGSLCGFLGNRLYQQRIAFAFFSFCLALLFCATLAAVVTVIIQSRKTSEEYAEIHKDLNVTHSSVLH
ncbi:hypothetical protein L596_020260 [Steinernema carpocapsae]|nr:hypothetical protein L596_020260 [Steinernema carpocapsae]